MLLVPSVNPVVSRRRVLVGAATLSLLGAASAACGTPPPPPEVDELIAQIERARNDGSLATRAAAAARPPLAQTLTELAAERAEHVRALEDELTRLVRAGAPTTTTTSSSTPAEPVKPPTAAEVAGALRQSAESAAGLAAQLSGYRAGLLGSIAAACTAAYLVALAPEESS
ncbi:hypothetical protein O6P37_24635 [Mycobacterium sp. CPCC 205372]|uniref:Tat pathway signal protein n=2 Tax=Mycobacteriaceae TaxID=1762 RepID=A0ABT4Q032_9MYCO|nr:hypothetical protein [Mycobacterium hippophais]MCZ8382059.1 hypothetical protein [Mycobacterium hippophais]